MSLTIVEHETSEPALFGALAAAVGLRRGAQLMHVPVVFDMRLYPDAVQHVTACGSLVASGLVWYERLSGKTAGPGATIAQIAMRARENTVVVPHHPYVAPDNSLFSSLAEQAAADGIEVERLRTAYDSGIWRAVDAETNTLIAGLGGWTRDRFGRLQDAAVLGSSDSYAPPELHIALIGAERDHRSTYPAVLAALGDAAEAEALSIEIRFIPPADAREPILDEMLNGVDGIVLPGGSAMANVSGQIAVAQRALRSNTPALGLCLGMQTMTTAVARSVPALAACNLAEADPSAAVKTFVPILSDEAPPAHRLGEHSIRVTPGSRLAQVLGPAASVRCNHRHRLNPELLRDLERAGLSVTAWNETGAIADGVEVGGHRFFMGLQGHPELSSRQSDAHPLFRAFLRACRPTFAG